MWKDNVKYHKAQHKATIEVNQALTRAAMVFWRDYHVYHSIKYVLNCATLVCSSMDTYHLVCNCVHYCLIRSFKKI